MRLPFLRPKSTDQSQPAKSRGRAAPITVDDPAGVEAARTQARRRLVGALVLLVIGVVGFPVLFETQPRPLPVNTPIEVLGRESYPGVPSSRDSAAVKPLPVTTLPADAGIESAPATAVTASAPVRLPAAASAPALAAAASSAASTSPRTAAAQVTRPPPVASAAVPAGKTAAPAVVPPAKVAAVPVASAAASRPTQAAVATPASQAASASGRFVVQAGAYTEAGKLREARAKIEQLGLKTYTQVIETDKGSRTRVRVGPYGSKAEADAVADKIKRSGLPAAIVAL